MDVGGRVLEIGAIPSDKSLLTLPALRGCERIGVNIEGDVSFDGFPIIACNSNDMPMFADGHFDCVLTNATIEHDPFFWKTCAEVRRVLRPGGVAVIGGPGFTMETSTQALGLKSPWQGQADLEWEKCAVTYRYHTAPDDYYRFSPSAFRDVVFEGFSDVTITSLMVPPRLIGHGVRT